MQSRTYPNSDLTGSEFDFGLWTTSIGWWGSVDATVISMLYDREQLHEFTTAPDTARLTPWELTHIASRYSENFGVIEEPMKFKGTMTHSKIPA